MIDAADPIAVLPASSPAAVALSLRTAAAPARAWEAISAPGALAKWFGAFEGDLRAGGTGRFDFGDGDFFDVVFDEVRGPSALGCSWRFLGTGPQSRIRWLLRPTADGGGTLLSVDDDQPGRSAGDLEEMRAGWRDFLERLDRFLSTGDDARYGWSKAISGSAVVHAAPETAARRLLGKAGRAAWLPFTSPPPASASASDGDDAATRAWQATLVAPAGAAADAAGELRFDVRSPAWRAPTRARVRVGAWPGGPTLLTITHEGWTEIGGDEEHQRSERRAACARWVVALRSVQAADGRTDLGDVA